MWSVSLPEPIKPVNMKRILHALIISFVIQMAIHLWLALAGKELVAPGSLILSVMIYVFVYVLITPVKEETEE